MVRYFLQMYLTLAQSITAVWDFKPHCSITNLEPQELLH